MSPHKLLEEIAVRCSILADMAIDDLRSLHPDPTDSRSESIRMCKSERLTRGQIIEAILLDEFEDVYVEEGST